MLKYARKYGSFLSFSIVSDRLFLVSDPAALEYINKTNARNFLDRWTPPGFELLLYKGNLSGLVFSQGKHWMYHRQAASSVFRSSDFLKNLADVSAKKASYLVDVVWKSDINGLVNVHEAMRMLTLDIIGEAAFGAKFGAMEAGSHIIEKSLSAVLGGVLDVIKSPLPLWRFMKTPSRARLEGHLHTLHEIELDLIRTRRERLISHPHEPASDLLAVLLKVMQESSEDANSARAENFDDRALMWDVHDVIFAGHETTAAVLAAALWLIAGSPDVLRRIRLELSHVLEVGVPPSVSQLSQLTYLDMVLNEAMRLYPPTALIGRVAKENVMLCGYDVPAGSSILTSPYVMGRLESLWTDPLSFRPDRFSPEQVKKRHPMTHTPFGAGPRVCLGARMAKTEAKVVLATILSRFSFERSTNELVVDYDSTVSFKSGMDMWLKPT